MIKHTLYKFAMNICGRQSEIGVQRSRHRVTNCNERARIDVEESRGNERRRRRRRERDEMRWDGKEAAKKGDESKRSKEEDEETLESVTRLELSNGNHKSVIASGLSKAKYNYRLLRRAKQKVRAHKRDYSCFSSSLQKCIEKSRRAFIRWHLRFELLSYNRRRDMITGSRHTSPTHFCIS